MSDDWKAKLQQFGHTLAKTEIAALLEQGRYQAVLDELPDAQSGEDRKVVARCHYELMKEECARGDKGMACDHARKVLQSASSAPRALLALAQARLTLLTTPPAGHAGAHYLRFEPGVAMVDGIGRVYVLGGYSAYGHHGTLNGVVHLLKKAPEELDIVEQDQRDLQIGLIGDQLATLLRECAVAPKIDLILPVPADADRTAARGYSQQAAIARALSAYAAIPMYPNLLLKVRSTQSMHGLGPKERERELAGSMGVAQDKAYLLADATVLVVDDVVTHGTDLREAHRALKVVKIKSLVGCALATGRDNLVRVPSGDSAVQT